MSMPWFAWLYCVVFVVLLAGIAWLVFDTGRIVRKTERRQRGFLKRYGPR